MKIKNRLQISTIFSVGLTIVLGLVLVSAAQAMNSINAKIRIVDETVTGMFELNILTHDYLLNPEERSLTQWRSKHSSITNILVSDEFRSPEEQVILNDMRQEHDSLKGIFDRLVASQEEHGGGEEDDVVYQELRERLSGQLSVKLQKVVSGSLQLADLNRANLVTAQRIGSLVIALTIVFAAVAAGITFWSSTSIVKPIAELTQAADSISKGDFYAAGDSSQRVEVTSRDEFGVLARAFSSMITQLRDSIETLEQRAHELEQRSAYLAASADVGRAAASILDADALIREVVDLIRERFDLYYVGLFLVDEMGEWAVLRAGTGEAGRKMLERGHRLKVGEGMIGWSVAHAEARIALDVADKDHPGADAVRFDNPDLPETRSEGALPLRSRGQVLGALTVQSREEAAFDQDTLVVLQTMADQVAVALDNAALFAESQVALEAERRAYGEISREAWLQMARTRPELGYLCDAQDNVVSVSRQWRPEMVEVGQEGRTIRSDDHTVGIPLKVRDQVVGVVRLRKPDEAGEWADEEIALMETLTEQLGRAVDGARLYQDTQRRAAREQLTGEVTARMRETLDVETVLKTAVREMRLALDIAAVEVRLDTEPGEGGNGEDV